MIYAEISPAANKVEQITPFSSVTSTANYMIAFARQYVLGADKVTFNVVYGTPQLVDGRIVGFNGIITNEVILESSELSSWGTDDAVVFSQIANKIGVTVVSTQVGANIF
jgi:hypothetical protein